MDITFFVSHILQNDVLTLFMSQIRAFRNLHTSRSKVNSTLPLKCDWNNLSVERDLIWKPSHPFLLRLLVARITFYVPNLQLFLFISLLTWCYQDFLSRSYLFRQRIFIGTQCILVENPSPPSLAQSSVSIISITSDF